MVVSLFFQLFVFFKFEIISFSQGSNFASAIFQRIISVSERISYFLMIFFVTNNHFFAEKRNIEWNFYYLHWPHRNASIRSYGQTQWIGPLAVLGLSPMQLDSCLRRYLSIVQMSSQKILLIFPKTYECLFKYCQYEYMVGTASSLVKFLVIPPETKRDPLLAFWWWVETLTSGDLTLPYEQPYESNSHLIPTR